MSKLVETREKLNAKRRELAAIFDKYPDLDMPADVAADIKARNDELTDLGKEFDRLSEAEAARKANADALEHFNAPLPGLPTPSAKAEQRQVKSVRQLLDESPAYQAFRAGRIKTATFEIPDETAVMELGFKTLLTSGDWVLPPQRLPSLVESVQNRVTVSDLMLQGTTDNSSITYMEETTFTNAAVEVAEGGTKPESALDFTERTDSVRKIATWIPATDELLNDIPLLDSYIRQRLSFMVEKRRESQLLVGDGTAPNISGILDRSGIQTQAKGADPTPDAFYKAMVKVMVTGDADPTAAVVHPNDWQDIRLLRTTDGIYIWGSPADAGPERIWGLPVRVTTGITEGTGLVGAFRPHAMFIRRSGITVTVSTEHSTYFVENKVAILAEERVALAVFRPAAFASVTGI